MASHFYAVERVKIACLSLPAAFQDNDVCAAPRKPRRHNQAGETSSDDGYVCIDGGWIDYCPEIKNHNSAFRILAGRGPLDLSAIERILSQCLFNRCVYPWVNLQFSLSSLFWERLRNP